MSWTELTQPITDILTNKGASINSASRIIEQCTLSADVDGHRVFEFVVSVDGDAVQVATVRVTPAWQAAGLGSAALRAAEGWAKEKGLSKMRLQAAGDGRLAWRAMRPQARLLANPTFQGDWKLSYPGMPVPTTVGEVPTEFAARCGGYGMEWDLSDAN